MAVETVAAGSRALPSENRHPKQAMRRRTAVWHVLWLGLAGLLPTLESRAETADVVLLGAGSSYAAPGAAPGAEDAQRIVSYFSPEALADLVAPIALYPDDLLAIVLPASTQPRQIAAAADLLERRQSDSAVAPDEAWDPAVIALLNYPEVLEKLNGDLGWTRDLGAAVRNQEAELLAAISGFREAAYAAGNLRSDHRLRVDRQHGALAIRPAHPQALYVPYYDVTRVTVRQAEPVYHFYPRPYPVYYYPYADGFPFAFDDFWGVRSRYTLGWRERHVFHSRSHVETLRYHAGTPTQHSWGQRRPLAPAHTRPPPDHRHAIPANPRHPGRDLAENPRHPGRNLALYPRHPGRIDLSERHHGSRPGFRDQGYRAPAAVAPAPDSGGQAAAGRSSGARLPYQGAVAPRADR